MSRTTGPRFDGGYQFMRASSVQLKRRRPIKLEQLGDGAYAQIVPLTGGRAGQFDVCGEWRDRAGVYVSSSYLAGDELEAIVEFQKLITTIRSEHQ
jgi:hypothetical protein